MLISFLKCPFKQFDAVSAAVLLKNKPTKACPGDAPDLFTRGSERPSRSEWEHRGANLNVSSHRKGWSTLWSSPIDPVVISSTWPRNAPTSFQSLKTPGTHTSIGCWSVSWQQCRKKAKTQALTLFVALFLFWVPLQHLFEAWTFPSH